MSRRIALVSFLVSIFAVGPAAAASTPAPLSTAALERLDDQGVHDIVVRREPGLTAAQRGDLRSDAGVTHVDTMRIPDSEVVHAPDGQLADAIAQLNADPGVEYAEPNLPVHATTSDPYWDIQWGLQNTGQLVPRIGGVIGISGDDIDAPDAWETTSGAGETVAVVDTGVELDQADLQGAIATNAGEIGIDSQGHDRETNGLDDDHDGYVDDWRGWDFVDRDNTPQDLNGHGTHVTGIIAARRDNGLGIAGVAPQAQVLPVRVLDASGSGSTANVANALDYAGDLGIKIVNASLGSTGFSKAEQDAISSHPNTMYVVAAGNGGSDSIGDNDDASGFWPCVLPMSNVVCVGATDSSDSPAPFSNFGRVSVDLFAPGVSIASAWIDDATSGDSEYVYASGTSMATPMVSATVALMHAANPALGTLDLRSRLLSSVDKRSTLTGKAATGGRLDAATAVQGAVTDLDTDSDGFIDSSDNCPLDPNGSQADADGDGIGDACDPDRDGDGFNNDADAFPDNPSEHADADGDGVGDNADNCADLANPDQSDADHDGIGDACDATPTGAVITGHGTTSGGLDSSGGSRPDDTPVPGDNHGLTAPGPSDDATPGGGATPGGVPTAQAPPTVAVSAIGVAPPSAPLALRLSHARLSASTLSAGHPRTLWFTLSRAARVTVTFSHTVHGHPRAALVLKMTAPAGTSHITLRATIDHHRLARGSYRVVVQATSGSQRASAQLRLTVH